MRQLVTQFFVYSMIVLGAPFATLAYEPTSLDDFQNQLNSQAEEIAALRESLGGKVDNGTSKNTITLNGRIHGIPGTSPTTTRSSKV